MNKFEKLIQRIEEDAPITEETEVRRTLYPSLPESKAERIERYAKAKRITKSRAIEELTDMAFNMLMEAPAFSLRDIAVKPDKD